MKDNFPYLNRDVTWLSFNYRVLQEAMDARNPLFERIKFLAIYSSNLGEFFRVRVASLRSFLRLGKKDKKRLEIEAKKKVLKELLTILREQAQEFSDLFNHEIIPSLAQNGIHFKRINELSEAQLEFVHNFYEENKFSFGRPVMLIQQNIRPSFRNASLYLLAHLQTKDEQKNDRYMLINIPSELPRFIELPTTKEGEHDIIILDEIVRLTLPLRLPDYEILGAYSMKLTRDADLYIDDEFSGDLVRKIERSLALRNVGPTSRFVYDRSMPKAVLDYMIDYLSLDKKDLLPEGRYHNNFDFFKFPSFGKKHLKDNPLPPLSYSQLESEGSIFDKLLRKDHLLHFPYHSYESVVQFFEQAADDPSVTTIKIVQYRVAKVSRIMDALMKAAKSGKSVVAFVEIKARFDEEANLVWADRLKNAGVKVIYSFPGLKVHSKTALVERIIEGKKQKFSYLGTGNFHESTAKLYSDIGLLTADKNLTTEVGKVFDFLESEKRPKKPFEHLLVGQFNLREHLTYLIERETKLGKKGRIILKVNSLEDKAIIDKLYEASQAGVKIDLIVRGICCLVPGIKGISDNINIISIVGRYLEHARIFIFNNKGKVEIFLSSADTMTRNLSRRVEVAFPIYHKALKDEILHFIDLQLNDNLKARIIDGDQKNEYQTNGLPPYQSQLAMYDYLQNIENISNE